MGRRLLLHLLLIPCLRFLVPVCRCGNTAVRLAVAYGVSSAIEPGSALSAAGCRLPPSHSVKGLIIHEGPSVFRIFKRWQAVNQQWKVLNYDKMKDLEDQKTGNRTNQRTTSQTNHSSSAGGATTSSTPADSVTRGAGHTTGTLSDHHCAYTILHILSHLRPHEQRSHSSTNRELVMRVTTV